MFYLIVPAEKSYHCRARVYNADFYGLPISYSLPVYLAVDTVEACSECHFVTGVFSSGNKRLVRSIHLYIGFFSSQKQDSSFLYAYDSGQTTGLFRGLNWRGPN